MITIDRKVEEKESKKKCIKLFDDGLLNKLEPGKFESLKAIHNAYLKIFMILQDK